MIHWAKVGAVWIGCPEDEGVLGAGGVRCYLIGTDIDPAAAIGNWMLTAVLVDGEARGIEEDTGVPAQALRRLQARAEDHYRQQGTTQ